MRRARVAHTAIASVAALALVLLLSGCGLTPGTVLLLRSTVKHNHDAAAKAREPGTVAAIGTRLAASIERNATANADAALAVLHDAEGEPLPADTRERLTQRLAELEAAQQ